MTPSCLLHLNFIDNGQNVKKKNIAEHLKSMQAELHKL